MYRYAKRQTHLGLGKTFTPGQPVPAVMFSEHAVKQMLAQGIIVEVVDKPIKPQPEPENNKPAVNIDEMTVKELETLLDAAELPKRGSKAEKIARLQEVTDADR